MATKKQISEFREFVTDTMNEYIDNIEEIEYDMNKKLNNIVSIIDQFTTYINGYVENWEMNKSEFPDIFKTE